MCLNSMQTTIQKIWNFSGRDIISDYEFLLSILNAFTVGTEEYYPKCNNVNDAKGLQIFNNCCNIILLLKVANHKYWWLQLDSNPQPLVYWWIWLKEYQIIHLCVIWPVWLNGWVFVYKLSGCGFESSCSHLNFRFHICFEQGVPWHSGKECGFTLKCVRDMTRTYSHKYWPI